MWTALFSFLEYIGPNVAWDSIKAVSKVVMQEKEYFQEVLYDSFLKAFDKHADCYDEFSSQMLRSVKKRVKQRKNYFKYWIESIEYGDFGKFIEDLRNKKFIKRLSSEFIKAFEIERSGGFDILPNIIEDVFSLYRISILTGIIKSNNADELILLEVLKIESVLESLEDFRQQINLLPEIKNQLEELKTLIACSNNISIAGQGTVMESVQKDVRVIDKVKTLFEERRFNCTDIHNNTFQASSNIYFDFLINIHCSPYMNFNELIIDIQSFLVSTSGNICIIVLNEKQYETIQNAIPNQQLAKIITFDRLVGNSTSLIIYALSLLENLKLPDYIVDDFYGIADNKIVDIVDYIDELNADDGIQKLAMLGDYGIGKTIFCRFYARHCVSQYKYNRNTRLPIYLDMNKFAKQNSLIELALEEINKESFLLSEFELRELIRMGKILFIVDNIEAIQTELSFETIIRLIDSLGELPSSKILIAARTHYFKSQMQQQRIKEYRTVYIRNWSLADSKKYLIKRYKMHWKEIANQIFSSFHLLEIFQTPLFATELCDIFDNGIRLHSDIFNKLITSWMAKNYYYFYLDTKIKLEIIEKVACLLYYGDVLNFSGEELLDIISLTGIRQENIPKYSEDILTSSFFIRDSDDKYRFSHYSIMEYFVSLRLKNEINNIIECNASPEFMSKKKLTLGIHQFLAEMIINKQDLIELVLKTKHKSFDETGYTGSNCISILKSMGVELKNRDFSHCVLVDADFRNMNLSGSVFRETNLFTANFDNCILDNVDFSKAEMEFSSIKEYSGIFDFLIMDESVLYLGTMQNTIYAFDVKRRAIKATPSIHSDSIWSLYHAEDMPWFFSGGRDHRLIMWSNAGEIIRIFDGHNDNIWKISAGSDNNCFASCSSDKTIKIWDIGSSSALFTLKGHTDVVRDIVFGDNQRLYSCGIDKRLICWNLKEKGKSKPIVYICHTELRCITKTDGEVIVGDSCGNLMFFDLNLNFLFEKNLHKSEVRSICYDKNQKCVVSGDSSGCISVYYMDEDRAKIFNTNGSFINRIRVFRDKIYSVNFNGTIDIMSFDGEMLLSDNVNHEIYKESNKFSCRKMKLSPDVHLSRSRKQFLIERGAEIIT